MVAHFSVDVNQHSLAVGFKLIALRLSLIAFGVP